MSGSKKTCYATCPKCGDTVATTFDPHHAMHGAHLLTHGRHLPGLLGMAAAAIGAGMTAFTATKSCRFHCDCGHSFFAIGE